MWANIRLFWFGWGFLIKKLHCRSGNWNFQTRKHWNEEKVYPVFPQPVNGNIVLRQGSMHLRLRQRNSLRSWSTFHQDLKLWQKDISKNWKKLIWIAFLLKFQCYQSLKVPRKVLGLGVFALTWFKASLIIFADAVLSSIFLTRFVC